jgi:DNA-binding transcriptional MerR regulator
MDEETLPPSMVEIAEEIGISYRRIDYYVRLGYIHCDNPFPGSGSGKNHQRTLDEREVDVLRLMCKFIQVGFMPESAALLAQRMVFDQSLTTTLPGGITITLTEEPDSGDSD